MSHPFEPDDFGTYCRVRGCGLPAANAIHQGRTMRSRVVLVLDHDVSLLPEDVEREVTRHLAQSGLLTLTHVASLP